MILILFVCIKLSILHLCVSDLGYECNLDNSRNDPEIFLIEDNPSDFEDVNTQLNFKFRELCEPYYNITSGTLEESKQYENVIRFAVPYYDKKPIGNFEYAGNITKTGDAVCYKTNITEHEDCNEIANLVSQSLKEIDDRNIYDFVQKMEVTEIDSLSATDIYDSIILLHGRLMKITYRESCEPPFQKTSDLTTVLLCDIDEDPYRIKRVNIRPLTLIQIPHSYCHTYINDRRQVGQFNLNRLLAVLAPEPIELSSENSVPTIFYETPYMFSEDKVAFPNSMNLVPWQLLKYGFLKFIQTVGWNRVAIMTDDSEYSIDFEAELIALFSKSRLAYTVIRCEDANCEMEKISKELSRISAKIVIANVERKNAQYMVQNANGRGIIWLLRDMLGKLTVQNQFPEIFSFSLRRTNSKECSDVEDNILTGLSGIAQAYKYTANRDNNVKKPEFYRRFADKMKEVTPRITEATIEVHRIAHHSEKIASISVNEDGAEMSNFINPYASGRPDDGTGHCLVSTYDFYEPCEDPLVMILMFTVMMFVLTFLLIMCYFDKTSPFNDIRYQNF